MFDIKKFLAENQTTLNEDALESAKRKLRHDFEYWLENPSYFGIHGLSKTMEAIVNTQQKRRPRVPNPRNQSR